jgi:hypothetical protein
MDSQNTGLVARQDDIYSMLDPQRHGVVGVGSALVDILAREDDAFLMHVGAIKGGMTYVEKAFIDQTVARTTTPACIVPGGSACNTVVGIGRLGGWHALSASAAMVQWGSYLSTICKNRVWKPCSFDPMPRPVGSYPL